MKVTLNADDMIIFDCEGRPRSAFRIRYINDEPKKFKTRCIDSLCVSLFESRPDGPYPIQLKMFGEDGVFSVMQIREIISALEDAIQFVEDYQNGF